MLPQYENLRFEIRKLICSGKNKEAIPKINDYIKTVKETKDEAIDGDMWFGYYTMCLVLTRVGDGYGAKNIVKFLKKSIRFKVIDEQCIKSLWMLAIFYNNFYNVSHKPIIIKYYNACEKYYRLNNEFELLAKILTNKSIVTNNINEAEEALYIYEDLYSKDKIETDDYEGLIENCIEVYLNNQKYLKANQLLHRITNNKLYEKLRDKIGNQTPIKMVVDI